MAPSALAMEAVTAQVGRGSVDGPSLHCLYSALCSMGRENLYFPFPRGLGVGSMGTAPYHLTGLLQAQSTAVHHR